LNWQMKNNNILPAPAQQAGAPGTQQQQQQQQQEKGQATLLPIGYISDICLVLVSETFCVMYSQFRPISFQTTLVGKGDNVTCSQSHNSPRSGPERHTASFLTGLSQLSSRGRLQRSMLGYRAGLSGPESNHSNVCGSTESRSLAGDLPVSLLPVTPSFLPFSWTSLQPCSEPDRDPPHPIPPSYIPSRPPRDPLTLLTSPSQQPQPLSR
ncbi:unnamed protein product, partial [Pleuronectes platessa]